MALKLLRSSTFWGGLALWASIFPVMLLFSPAVKLALMSAMTTAVAAGICWGYGKAAFTSLKRPLEEMREEDALIIGIFISWLGNLLIFLAVFIWRTLGKPEGFIEQEWNLLGRWMLITGGWLHMSAANAIDGKVPTRAHIKAGWFIACGALVGMLIIAYQEWVA